MMSKKQGSSMSNDERMAVLETTIVSIHDVLQRIDKRFDSIDHKFESIDRRFESIDRRFESIDHKFESMERKFESKFDSLDRKMDHKFDLMDHKFELMDNKFENLRQEVTVGFRDVNNRLWFNFFWTIASFTGILGLIAKLFHWF